MKKQYKIFFYIVFLFLMVFAYVNELGGIICFANQREGSKMSNSGYYNRIKKETKFELWGGKTRSPATRFHHLVSPPEDALGSWHIATASHLPGSKPALDWQIWNINNGKGGEILFSITAWEHPSVNEAHEALILSLMSITRPGMDYSPNYNAPGDVSILYGMLRDNIFIEIDAATPIDPNTQLDLLKKTDEWLIGNWPLMASKEKSSKTHSLKVGIHTTTQKVNKDEPIELIIDVKKTDSLLKLKELPHRFLANPGRISWKNNSYYFSSDQLGKSEITLDVLGPEGEYGCGSITLEVVKK
jgi:hypothetical protein